MEQRTNDLRVRCRLNILRLYPAHKQAALTDRTDFDAWKAENVAHMQALAESGAEDIDDGWPDPKTWQKLEPTAAESMLEQLESVKDAIDSHPRHVEPPAAIADLFHPDKPMAPQAKALRDKWLEIGHQIHRGEASADEIRKHERLSSEIQFLNSHAFDGV